MDATRLRHAYTELLDAAEAVADRGDLLAPPDGGWDPDRVLAHVALVDAAALAAAAGVASGVAATFDNRLSQDAWTAARLRVRCGGSAGVRDRIRSQGEALCALAAALGEAELETLVPTLLVSGDDVLVEQPLPLGVLLGGLAEDHLPRHAAQVLAVLPARSPAEAAV